MASFLFGSDENILMLNGAEYNNPITSTRLAGSSPGFVGYGDGTDFDKIRRNPYSIILVDECEKMCKEAWQIFLGILEEGRLNMPDKKIIDFRNTVIIFTSNLGSEMSKKASLGVAMTSDKEEEDVRKHKFMKAIKEYFRPEVYNRLGKIVIFNDLREEDLLTIVGHELQTVIDGLAEKGIKISFSKTAHKHILDNSDDKAKAFGARPIKRSIEDCVNDVLANVLLENGDALKSISVGVKSGELTFSTKNKAKPKVKKGK